MGRETGGWAPKGFLTENGPDPSLAEKFGIKEHPSNKYPPRTYANARDSDGTLIFSSNLNSAGTVCTKRAANQYKRPLHIIPVERGGTISEIFLQPVVDWVREKNIKVLNVAGNRESKSPGIQKAVKEYVKKILSEV